MGLRRIGSKLLEVHQIQGIVLQLKETYQEIKRGPLVKVPVLTEFYLQIFAVKRCPLPCQRGLLLIIQFLLWGPLQPGTRRSLFLRTLLLNLNLSQSSFKFSLNHQIFQWRCMKAKNMKNWRSNWWLKFRNLRLKWIKKCRRCNSD